MDLHKAGFDDFYAELPQADYHTQSDTKQSDHEDAESPSYDSFKGLSEEQVSRLADDFLSTQQSSPKASQAYFPDDKYH
jgi:hypothetical protein